MQAFSTQNLSEDSVYDENNSTSSYEGDEPRSIAQVSRQTVESRSNDERIQRDLKLEAKAYILTLLNAGVSGSTIKDLVTSTDFISIDDTMHSKIAEAQNMLGLTLQKLVEQRQITDDGTYSDLLESIFWVSFFQCFEEFNFLIFGTYAMKQRRNRRAKSEKSLLTRKWQKPRRTLRICWLRLTLIASMRELA